MDKRARKLFRRAVQNQIFGASEYIWEADAWHDVFGSIRDDDTFRMLYLFLDVNAIIPTSEISDFYLRDKRPYEFIDHDAHGNKLVKRRIPDATMGLRTYSDLDLDHGYRINHDGTRPHKSLMGYRIHAQMEDEERGLIVDGIWGESNLIFPFAVYEAKKHASTLEQAKEQIYHAFRVYLAMLDDVARDPLDITQYQSEESTCYQLFGFISCGSYWEVYVAYNRYGQCHVDTIWKGDVKDFNRARELICLVNQVHEFAANQHRKFVIKHLEPWLGQFEDPKPKSPRFDENGWPKWRPGSGVIRLKWPAWRKIYRESKEARDTIAAESRSRKRLKVQDNARNRHSQASQKGRIIMVSNETHTNVQRTRDSYSNKRNGPQPKRHHGRPKIRAKTSTNP
ncbi:hypothetical protein AA0121_g13221 [Alternaria tenuissima]|nr:hypothetical protein AA0121_g13221 [Alternaria tenuissima]